MKTSKKLLILCLSFCFAVGENKAYKLQNIKNLKGETPKPSKKTNSKLKLETIKEVALSYSAQISLKITYDKIQKELLKNQKELDTIYNFAPLMVEKNVIAPVVITSTKTANISMDKQSVRTSNVTYEILKPATFVTNIPNWRNTLVKKFEMPELPPKSMLPKSTQEIKVWQEAVDKGWKLGGKQAHTIFKTNLSKMTRDIKGMLLYKKLNALNIVSKPYVGQKKLGILIKDEHIRVDDNIDKITAPSVIVENNDLWEPVVVVSP